jgi:hypothetical protein
MELKFIHRAEHYLSLSGEDNPKIAKKLGAGQEGYGWETARRSALKVFERQKNYNSEPGCYRILRIKYISDRHWNTFFARDFVQLTSSKRTISSEITTPIADK